MTRVAVRRRLHYAIPYDWRMDRWYYRMGWLRFLWRRFLLECCDRAECRDCGVVCRRWMFGMPVSLCDKCRDEDDKRFDNRE